MHKVIDWEQYTFNDADWEEDKSTLNIIQSDGCTFKVDYIADKWLNNYRELKLLFTELHKDYATLKQECNQAKSELRELKALIRQGITSTIE